MSRSYLPLTKKDKAIRLSASVAISGLTFSFLLAETIEAKFTNPNFLFSQTAQEKISLPVLQPVLAFGSLVEKIEIPDMPNFSAEESATLFARAHSASERTSELREPVSEAKLPEKIAPKIVVAKKVGGRAQSDRITIKAAAPIVDDKISGKIVGAEREQNSYFEVGLYNKIDRMGNPVGYPIVQQILPQKARAFFLDKPEGIQRAYLFARRVQVGVQQGAATSKFIAYPPNPISLVAGERLVGLDIPLVQTNIVQEAVATISSSAEKDKRIVRGRIVAMFSKKGSVIPVGSAQVKVRGSNYITSSDSSGAFQLDLSDITGDVLIEVIKPGYLPTIKKISLKNITGDIYMEIASREAIDQMAYSLGLRQASTKSVMIGIAKNKDGHALSGLTVQSTLRGEGPYYFNDDGFPSGPANNNKGTTSDGRFIIFNIDAGAGIMEASIGMENIAPFSIAAVEGGALIYKELEPLEMRIRGRVFNAMSTKTPAIVGAKVKVEGSAEWTTTDALGAFELPNLRFMRGEDIQLELSAEKFYLHHYQIAPGVVNADIFAFPSAYISSLAQSVDVALDPYAAIVVGSVGQGKNLRMDALSDHSLNNTARDFYFGNNQVIRGSYGHTDEKFGTYIIFNVPRGRTLLQGVDLSGKLKNSRVLHTNASTVNVVIN